MCAYLLDLLIRGVVLLVVSLILLVAMSGSQAVGGVVMVLAFVLEWGYYVLFETIAGGRTIGKRALGLRVVKEGGYPIGFIDSVLRNLLRGADILPFFYVVGLFAMAGDSRFRRIGDRVAGTLVVVEEKSRAAAPLTILPPPTRASWRDCRSGHRCRRGARDAGAVPPPRRPDRGAARGAGADDRPRPRPAHGGDREGSGPFPGAAAPPDRRQHPTARG
jgi:uncharacterized RDD family membrane protein YckC